MRSIESNGIKIYELSKGSVIPEYLGSRRQQQLKKKHNLMTSQLQVIHDLSMPDISTNISISPDEKYLFVLGAYSPRIRCYELEQLSMKFERNVDELPSKIAYIDQDYSKFVVLEGLNTLSFHSAGGLHKKVPWKNVIKDLIYSPFKNHIFLPDNTGSVSLLNIELGDISSNIVESSDAVINCAGYNPIADLLLTGTVNGIINSYDARSAKKINIIDVRKAPISEYMKKSYVPEVSKIVFKDHLKFGVGTDKGMFHLYDIRNNSKPFSSRDLDYEFPVKNIIFHEEKVIAAVKSVFKIWEPIEGDEGKTIACYDTNSTINDFIQFPGSGLFFAATNEPLIQTFFIPRIADAPPFCQQLSNLIVDVEAESQSMYDTHTFVTREEIDELGLTSFIGTANLRAYMHGYYISNDTYKRARNTVLAARQEDEAAEMATRSGGHNGQGALEKSVEEWDELPDPKVNVTLKCLMGDERYRDLFEDDMFALDPKCHLFDQVNQDMRHVEKKRRKKLLLKTQAKKSKRIANNESDDEDDLGEDSD